MVRTHCAARPARPAKRLTRPARGLIAALVSLALVLAPAPPAWSAERTPLKPGWNMFSPEQDIQLGRETAQQAEQQVVLLNDRRVDDYVNRLGQRLAAKAPGYRYPYRYKVVNDSGINAFALPGGPVYINRGIIESAENEAQLAGVIAHETAHVALRHGTNQASKAYAWQIPLSVLGAVVGGNSVAGLLTQLAAGFTLNSVLLKYSRDDETQADVLGTQLLYDTNYDPRAMGQFFEKLQAESRGREPIQFFSSHPNPGNRMARVNEEVGKLGGPPRNYTSDTSEFQAIKRYVRGLPAAPKPAAAGGAAAARPAPPASRMVVFRTEELELRHPENWRASGQASAFTLSPQGGIVRDSRGNEAVAYGVMVNLAGLNPDGNRMPSLEEATNQLIAGLRRSNPGLEVARRAQRIRLDGRPALSTYLSNDSPLGGKETDWLVTTMRPEGLLYIVCVVPDNDHAAYERAFQSVVSSIRFR